MNLPDLYQVLAGAVGTTVVLRGTTFPIKIASVHRAGSRLVLEGCALDGSKVTRTLASRSESPLVPAWAIRLGSMLRLSWGTGADSNWDRIIKKMIAEAHLPVDPKMHWGAVLYNIFAKEWGLAKGDSELLDELIQESVVSMLLRRSIEGFDPNKVVDPGPGFEKLPLAEKVSKYVIQLLHGQAGERSRKENGPNGYKNLNADSLDHDNADPFDDEEGEGGGQRKELADSEIVQDSDDEVRSLSQIRDAFENWLQKRRGGQQPYKIMLVFDLWTREPSQIDAVRAWKDITNTGYRIYNATQKLLREAFVQFARSGPLRRDPFLVRVVNDLRLKSFQGDESPETTEPLRADPDLIPAEPEPAPAPVEPPVIPPGPKAKAMKSSALGEGLDTTRPTADTKVTSATKENNMATKPKDDGDENKCRTCGGPNDNGEGWDGECGSCADHTENQKTKKESAKMPTPKQAAMQRRAALNQAGVLRRLAAEAPEEISTKIETLKQHMLDQVSLLENFQDQLDMTPEGASKFEGEPDEPEKDQAKAEKPEKEEKKDEEKPDTKFAGLRRAAEEEPEEIEDAIQDFFLGLDEIMAETESLADTLGVELVAPAVGDGDGDADDGLHGEQPIGEGDVVEFSGTADPETAKRMFDVGAADVEEEEADEPGEGAEEFTVPG